MLLNVILLLAGFIILIKGADWMVGGASSLAKKLKVSALVIGLTIVAFGTSAPEMTVNVINSIEGYNEALMGNILGSNIFNLLFILGVTGVIHPLVVQRNSVRYEVPLSMVAACLLYILVNDALFRGKGDNVLSKLDAFALLGGFLLFIYYIYRTMRVETQKESEPIRIYPTGRSVGMIVVGIGMLIGGGYLVTENAVAIAAALGLSEKLIGLTILAVGTSLPELATSIVAALKRSTDIAIGNVVGSNIFNIFFVTGVSGVIRPIAFPLVLNEDIYVLMVATFALLVSMFTLGRNKVDRWEAIVFLILYAAYTVYLIIRN